MARPVSLVIIIIIIVMTMMMTNLLHHGDDDNGVKLAWEEAVSSISLKHQSSPPPLMQKPRFPRFHL